MSFVKITDLNLLNKRVFIRSDLNVPLHSGEITCDARILAALPTIQYALDKGAKLILASHLGRPNEGEYDKNFSLLPIVNYLKRKLGTKIVSLVHHYLDGIELEKGKLVVLENVRFNKGEKNNDLILSKKYARLCDIFVMDAFATAHRKQASTYGIAKFASQACAGFLLISEINSLNQALKNPSRPMIAIVGGAKVSTKFNLLESLGKISDLIIVGGGIANTFLAIKNNIGLSLYEKKFITQAQNFYKKFNIFLPEDVMVCSTENTNQIVKIKNVAQIKNNEKIMDFGHKTIKAAEKILKKAKTILWNGPVGMFELPHFSQGTKNIAECIARSDAFSIAGGGDTLSAIDLFGVKDKISYISTGGGAFLEYLEKKTLPTIELLKK